MPAQMHTHGIVVFLPFRLRKKRKKAPKQIRQIPTINSTMDIVAIVSVFGIGIKSGIGKFIKSPPCLPNYTNQM